MKLQYLGFLPGLIVFIYLHYQWWKHRDDMDDWMDGVGIPAIAIIVMGWVAVIVAGIMWGLL